MSVGGFRGDVGEVDCMGLAAVLKRALAREPASFDGEDERCGPLDRCGACLRAGILVLTQSPRLRWMNRLGMSRS